MAVHVYNIFSWGEGGGLMGSTFEILFGLDYCLVVRRSTDNRLHGPPDPPPPPPHMPKQKSPYALTIA